MTFFLVAGEASGDRLGAALMAGLRHLQPGAEFAGVGGAVRLGAGEEVILDGLQALDDGGDEFGARDAGLLREHRDLAQVLDDHAEHGVVRDLPHTRQLALAHPHAFARHGAQIGLGQVVQSLGTRGHDQQLARFGHLAIARHGGTQIGHAHGFQALAHFA